MRFCFWLSVQFSSVAQSRLTLWDPVDCSPPGSSVHGISQARILECIAISYSRDLPDPWIEPLSSAFPALAGGFFTTAQPENPKVLNAWPYGLTLWFLLTLCLLWTSKAAQPSTMCLPSDAVCILPLEFSKSFRTTLLNFMKSIWWNVTASNRLRAMTYFNLSWLLFLPHKA